MKNILLFSAGIASFFFANAQSFSTLTVNHLQAGFNASGDQLSQLPNYTNSVSTPQNSISYAAGNLWIGGYDAGGQLHMAAQTYRQSGDDFWAGPLDTNTLTCSVAQNTFYNNVWKINKTTIDSFRQGYFTTIPASISGWPGNGNPAAGEGHYMAPFVDVDNDGLYLPSNGDYPQIRGDQALFWVYNDHLINQTHGETGAQPMGVEIHCLAYAVNCADSALANTVFVHYTIINRATVSYNSTMIGLWNDVELSSAATKIGSDSLLGCFYTYDTSFAFGAVFLNQNMGTVMYYKNDFSAMGNPQNAGEYYDYLGGHFADGTPVTYGGSGYYGNSPTSFVFTGDPETAGGWVYSSTAQDPRMTAATAPFQLMPGQVIDFDIAYVAANDPSATTYHCATMLKQRIQSVKNYYATGITPCGNNINSVAEQPAQNNILLYPNPAQSTVILQSKNAEPRPYAIYNSCGQLLLAGLTSGNETRIDISSLPAGMYFVRTGEGANTASSRFLKAG